MKARRQIRVLVIDDSAVVRQVLTAILSAESDISVVTAHEPVSALRKMNDAPPDVILLDLEMPRMDGISFLRQIKGSNRIPVVICSAFTGSHTEAAVRALEYGAIDMVKKPAFDVRGFLDDSARTLVELVRAAAGSKHKPNLETGVDQKHALHLTADVVLPKPGKSGTAQATDSVVAIGASTGGTVALHKVLGAMPVDCPGIVVVQHMPVGFTAAFAKRLNETCRIEVKEAAEGDRVLAGRALIARGDEHLIIRAGNGGYTVHLLSGPAVSRHRPSVDVLFRSVASAAGAKATGVLLTGMGEDGAQGLLEMRLAGARTIAQDEASSVVFGMPREAIARGGVQTVSPLPAIALEILGSTRRKAGKET
jgi:two-component system, chemotaxis family, protein-glutamate methylesterase/glutaminase